MADEQVEVWLRDNQTGSETTLQLGEFQAVWKKGVTIGCDDDCDIVLKGPGIARKQVSLSAMSNHKFLKALDGLGTIVHGREMSAGQKERIDGRVFQIAHYSLRLLGANY